MWDAVSSDLIAKCVNTRPYAEVIDNHDDPFEREDELPSLQQLVHGIDSTYNALTFISSDDQNWCMPGMTEIPTGEKRSRTISYDKDDEIAACPWGKWKRGSGAAEVDFDEYYNPELKEPALKTVAEEIGLAGQPKDLTQYYGHENFLRAFPLELQNIGKL